MYLVSVIPLTYVPRQEAQVFTYFYPETLERGTLAEAPIGKRNAVVLVLGSEEVKDKKTEIRKASFSLKGLTRPFNEHPVVSEDDIKFIEWMGNYYFSPPGYVARSVLPAYLLSKEKLSYGVSEQYRGEKNILSYSQSPLRFAEYTKIIEKNAYSEKQTLVLFPEVLEAEIFFQRLPSGLQEGAALWTKSRTPKQEYLERIKLLARETHTVIGTRSAALLQLPWLGSIIVEGEENGAHKSWDQHPKYDARTLALWRAKTYKLPLMFGSEFPSSALYERMSEAGGPLRVCPLHKEEAHMHVIDMREEMKHGNSSPLSMRLQEELSQLGHGRQGVLLMNRRGEYTVVLCRDCGHTLTCDLCEVSLITLQGSDHLLCRLCGKSYNLPAVCPACKGIHFKKFGSGTQRIVEEISRVFPDLCVERFDADNIRTLQDQQKIVHRFDKGEIDVLVGTKMVVKPRLFPKADVTAVVSLEASLLLPEYDGEEQAYIMAHKMRSMAQRTFLWQTYQPRHPAITALESHAPERFLQDTLKKRKAFLWPPTTQLILLTLRGREKGGAEREAQLMHSKLEKVVPAGVILFDPLPAHTHKVKGRFVWEILLSVSKKLSVHERNLFLEHVPSTWEVDVDPISTIN